MAKQGTRTEDVDRRSVSESERERITAAVYEALLDADERYRRDFGAIELVCAEVQGLARALVPVRPRSRVHAIACLGQDFVAAAREGRSASAIVECADALEEIRRLARRRDELSRYPGVAPLVNAIRFAIASDHASCAHMLIEAALLHSVDVAWNVVENLGGARHVDADAPGGAGVRHAA